MSLRKFLLLPLLISLALFVYFSSAVDKSLQTLINSVHLTHRLTTYIFIAVLLQLIGHLIRAHKARLLLRPVKESSTRFQFRALSVGYLFNTILPFRLGELIRARIISGAMTISFGFALVLIIFERAIDAFILGIAGLVIIPAATGHLHGNLLSYAVLLTVISVALFALLIVLARQNVHLLKFWYRVSAWFNPSLRDSFRFKAWSIIYGLQRTLNTKSLLRYLGLSLLSWLFYGASILVLAHYFFPAQSPSHQAMLSVAPYYGSAIPSGPANLGVFSRVTDAFTLSVVNGPDRVLVYTLLVWAVLVLPIAAIGLGLLFVKTKETLWQTRPKSTSADAFMDKLYRAEDISSEMSAFLENYFSGNSLSLIVHQLELRENFRLLRYFKGGSDAITILALQNNQQIVKKIIPLEFEDRLKAQHDWLVAKARRPGIVRALGEQRHPNFYAIDLEYDADNEMFYDYIHRNPLSKSERALENVWRILYKNVYGKTGRLTLHKQEREQYIKRHILGCLEKAAAVDAELIRASEPKRLLINGQEYDNLHQIMDKIKQHPQAWEDIGTYRTSSDVHGDIIVDNLLISKRTDELLIIDPAPDGNIIQGPVFDFGKSLQSLYCGYETMLRDESPVYLQDENVINYQDHKSVKYTRLSDYIRNDLAPKYLSESEQRAMLFHAAALHIRRLKHQVYYCPANTLKFYAIGVKTLNDFLDQYN